ncbi:MAG: hypothetical protein ACXACU_10705 [Candidatus Hodarchaeales archaeon]
MNPKSVDENLFHFPKADPKDMAEDVKSLAKQLSIPDAVVKKIHSELETTYTKAEEAISMVGGSPDDVSKLWGYNFAKFLFNYMSFRDHMESRQALSFIKMQLGYEINSRVGGSEMQFSSFVLGLSLRFIKGFEKLKGNLIELENALHEFEEHKYSKKKESKPLKKDLFGREIKQD